MGLFHCPLGAPYYDDDACIDCGLCYATTAEEKVEASRKIREYMKTHIPRASAVSKIAVCGKGGSGKTTAVALLALALKEAGRRVIVIDADESNPGLGRMLGIKGEPQALSDLFNEDGKFSQRERFSMDDIPPGFVSSEDGVRFMAVGKILDPFQGCACSLAESARSIVEKLELKEDEVLVLDMEAGVESFGRGVERQADTILAVVEPSLESIIVAGRIAQMAQGMGIGRVGAILNKMSSISMSARARQELEKRDVKIYGVLNYNPNLAEAAFEGKPVRDRIAAKEAGIIVDDLYKAL
ncbi:MAG: P-loop NTPase [Dehalococcoidia bacterium]|jgi:CO dehydrogenase maturation factor